MKKACISMVLLCLTSLYSSTVLAAPLIKIELVPSTLKIHPPENFILDIVISGLQTGGLNALVGSFNFDITYKPQLALFFADPRVGFGPALGDLAQGEAIGYADFSGPGLIRLAEISLLEATCASPPCSDPVLEDLQTDSFKAATLGFYAGAGVTGPLFFNITSLDLGDPFAQPIRDDFGQVVPIETQPASIAVSEPPILALEIIGLAVLIWVRRRGHFHIT